MTLLIIQFPLLFLSCHLMKSFRLKIQRNDMIRLPSLSSNIPEPSENVAPDTATNCSTHRTTRHNNMNTSDNNMYVKPTYKLLSSIQFLINSYTCRIFDDRNTEKRPACLPPPTYEEAIAEMTLNRKKKGNMFYFSFQLNIFIDRHIDR